MQKVVIIREDGTGQEAYVESYLDVELTKNALIINDVSGSTVVFNWDTVDRFVIAKPNA